MGHAASHRARRAALIIAAAAVIAAGLATHLAGTGALAEMTGDALYAVMMYLLIAAAFPRASNLTVGVAALTLCTMIELFQLTGLPAVWAAGFWPVRLILGAGFDPMDLAAYAAGAVIAMAGDLAVTGWRARAR